MAIQPWPDSHAGACVISVDVDGEVPLLWSSRTGVARLAELEQRRFGSRVGLRRLLDIFRERGVRGSFYVPGWYADANPELVGAIVDDGHEVGLHGYLHEPPTALSKQEFATAVERSLTALHRAAGVVPTGFRSPSWDMTADAFDVLEQAGLRYDSSMMGSDRPYTIGALVEVPVQWTLDDAPFYRYVGGTEPGNLPERPSELAIRWTEEFEAAERFGTLAVLTVHDWLSGRVTAALALDDVLRRLETLNLWRATADEVAGWHIRSAGRATTEPERFLP